MGHFIALSDYLGGETAGVTRLIIETLDKALGVLAFETSYGFHTASAWELKD